MATKNGSGAGRLVYSTESGRICPDCGRPQTQCVCKENARAAKAAPASAIVRVTLDTKGRKGKGVTLVRGLALDAQALATAARALKAACGSGGTAKDGAIEIQGDHRAQVSGWLQAQGYLIADRPKAPG